MLKEFMSYLIDLKKPEQIVVNNRTYFDGEYMEAKDPYPALLSINNLAGIMDYIKQMPETWDNMFLHIVDYDEVRLFQAMTGDFNQRCNILKANSRACQFSFGSYMDVESFIIYLSSLFKPGTDRDYILKFISGIRVDANAKLIDNGISQTVIAKKGTSSLVSEEQMRNIVSLRPFRTFTEVPQPESQFIFRMRLSSDEPVCALHECDGEAWKQTAIQEIKVFFEDNGIEIPIIA